MQVVRILTKTRCLFLLSSINSNRTLNNVKNRCNTNSSTSSISNYNKTRSWEWIGISHQQNGAECFRGLPVLLFLAGGLLDLCRRPNHPGKLVLGPSTGRAREGGGVRGRTALEEREQIKLLSLAQKWRGLTCATAPRLPGPWFGAVAARSSCFGTNFVSSGSREMSSCGPATEEDPEPLEAAEFLFLAPATPPTCFLRQGEGENDWLPWPPPPPPDRPWLR